MKHSILILHASGINRDQEAARACELAGGRPEIVHINRLRSGDRDIHSYDMLLLPGGFSYGDALGAGARLALDLRMYFQDQLLEFVSRGKLVLGICNGFQTLVKAGILPGAAPQEFPPLGAAREQDRFVNTQRRATLTENASGRFECRWVHLAPNRSAAARYLAAIDDLISCPIAHGEGNFQVSSPSVISDLDAAGCIALRYVNCDGSSASGAYPANPNGSAADIAGICNPAGNVLGLMPHPEDHIVPVQSLGAREPIGRGRLGLHLFKAMIGSIS